MGVSSLRPRPVMGQQEPIRFLVNVAVRPDDREGLPATAPLQDLHSKIANYQLSPDHTRLLRLSTANAANVTNLIGKEARDLEDSGPRERHEHPEVWSENGQEAEVDFGELYVELAGVKTKVFLFALRMSYSGKSAHRVFASQGLEAFVEGHLHAFAVLGGVPAGKIRYDNLRPAVSRVLGGRSRTESDQWVWFRSHVGFEAFYCKPGIEGAHEKGGVEGEIGRFRRNHLVPVPVIDTLAELNERIAAIDISEDARRIEGRARTIGADFATEAPLLAAMPEEVFEPGRMLTPRVDRYGCVFSELDHSSSLTHSLSLRSPLRERGFRGRRLLRCGRVCRSGRVCPRRRRG